ncbi:hypothetical protein CVT26_005791 [Gymnopilus dilepis]|uniref:Histone deacetylase domain-containing protein n=1 Tax=Gymnopilus dilepis TaxID=231916 RepID=A0A409YL18_9AGAR|nr:hypothetical protein CVT26_005791 [Gymnopilus dilepis]
MASAQAASSSNLGLCSSKSAAIFIQNACLQHRYIRSKDKSNIVERPERLRAVNIGLAAAVARLEELFSSADAAKSSPKIKVEDASNGSQASPPSSDPAAAADDLAATMEQLKIGATPGPSIPSSPSLRTNFPVSFIQTQATLDILSHPAVKFIHGDIDADVYLENLVNWVKQSKEKIANGNSEIPEGLSQGDLYLCPESLNAIQGAAATVCEAVDRVITSTRTPASQTPPVQRAFVAIRPPGHHCGEDTPSGFCFVNNVAIGAAHAHLQHGIKRIVIFDIDLHHGNGTQSIVWQINEETYRQTLESEGGGPNQATGPQIYYGSIHDILSYPCEDGKPALVQAASTSIHGSHGQWIENVHLKTYTSEEHFWDVLYKEEYSKLLSTASQFLESTGGEGDDVLVFISCGMDANEHEYPSMSRHNRKVPVSFYHRFARDACAFAEKYARGRVVSVLEGGYSDRALMSGALAHFCGLADVPAGREVDEGWWSVENLVKLETATKKRKGGRPSATGISSSPPTQEPWLDRTLAIFAPLEAAAQQVLGVAPKTTVPVPRSDRTLRERRGKAGSTPSTTPSASPRASAKRASKPVSSASSAKTQPKATIRIKPPSAALSSASTSGADSPSTSPSPSESETESGSGSSTEGEGKGGVTRLTPGAAPVAITASASASAASGNEAKKVPRVVLKLGKASEGVGS